MIDKIKKLFSKFWNIENKILVPFLLIEIISITVFGIVSYYTGYNLKMSNEVDNAVYIISNINKDINSCPNEEIQDVINKYKSMDNDNILILDELYNVVKPTSLVDDNIYESMNGIKLYNSNENRFGWNIYYLVDKSEFLTSLIDDQKYNILIAIALLLITIQASIFIAYNISDPIIRLSKWCQDIENDIDNYNKYSIILNNRHDEIGQLSQSFQNLLSNLNSYTNELIRVKNLNESIVENLPLGILVIDKNEQVILMNSNADEIVNNSIYKGKIISTIKKIINNSFKADNPYMYEISEDSQVYMNIHITSLEDRENKLWGYICTMEDITEKKKLEDKIAHNDKLIYMGEMSAMLAHEIKNPLAGIRTGMQVIFNRVEKQSDKVLCSSMISEIDRVTMLITNLLSLSANKKRDVRNVNIKSLIESLTIIYSSLVKKHNINLKYDINPDIYLLADENELKQIVHNLISNSIKALQQRDNATIYIIGYKTEAEIVLVVKDNGIGIDNRHIKNVTQPFYSKSVNGSGLGLTIVKKLVEDNGGRLYIKSELSKGTEVYMIFNERYREV